MQNLIGIPMQNRYLCRISKEFPCRTAIYAESHRNSYAEPLSMQDLIGIPMQNRYSYGNPPRETAPSTVFRKYMNESLWFWQLNAPISYRFRAFEHSKFTHTKSTSDHWLRVLLRKVLLRSRCTISPSQLQG